jgi:DNA primase
VNGITDNSVRDVIAAANIVDVVGQWTTLKNTSSGTRYIGRCPFQYESTVCFVLNADLGLYFCFACGKGGDVVEFVRETEETDFVGAIEWLAKRFKVTVEYE